MCVSPKAGTTHLPLRIYIFSLKMGRFIACINYIPVLLCQYTKYPVILFTGNEFCVFKYFHFITVLLQRGKVNNFTLPLFWFLKLIFYFSYSYLNET